MFSNDLFGVINQNMFFDDSRFKPLLPAQRIVGLNRAGRTINLPLPENISIFYRQTVLQNLLLLKQRKQTTTLSRLREIVESEAHDSFIHPPEHLSLTGNKTPR
jgi:hypothetical protein